MKHQKDIEAIKELRLNDIYILETNKIIYFRKVLKQYTDKSGTGYKIRSLGSNIYEVKCTKFSELKNGYEVILSNMPKADYQKAKLVYKELTHIKMYCKIFINDVEEFRKYLKLFKKDSEFFSIQRGILYRREEFMVKKES